VLQDKCAQKVHTKLVVALLAPTSQELNKAHASIAQRDFTALLAQPHTKTVLLVITASRILKVQINTHALLVLTILK
jgi:hypothetical protein